MRLFIFGFGEEKLGLHNIISQLQKQSHEICYWVYTKELSGVDQSQFPSTIFHYDSDALQGIPATGVDVSEFSPITHEQFNEFYKTELVVLTMMNKKYERLSIDERKHFYYHLLEYWNGVITKYRPDAIIFITIPHTVYDFIAYSLAKKYGIKTLMIEDTIVYNRCLLHFDYTVSPLELNTYPKASLSDLSLDLREYYRFQRGEIPNTKYIASTQIYMKNWKDMYSGFGLFFIKFKVLFLSLRKHAFLKKIYLFFKNRLGENIKKEYASVQSEIDFSKKFIYIPLGYQPERTTCPHGGIFVDQILMIEFLSAALPSDWVIYVKEHPAQWLPRGLGFFSYRYRGYYKTIAQIPKVKIIPVATDSHALIHASQAVAVVTGTAAWEAIIRSKPALVFGYIWFQDVPGIFKIRDFSSCQGAFEKINQGYVVNQEDVINYLAHFDKNSFHGYIQDYAIKVSELTQEENINNISQALLFGLENSKINDYDIKF